MRIEPAAPRNVRLHAQTFQTPIIWLAQSVDTSVLTARVPEMQAWPVLTSLGDAMRRPRYVSTHFTERLREKLGLCGPVMIDSGGFVLMSRDVQDWSVCRVAEVYRRVDADILVSLDHPPCSADTSARKREKHRLTLDNLDRLAAEFGPDKLMPVIHGDTIGEVEDSCVAVQAISPRPRWIGMGGLVPLLRQLGRDGIGSSRQRQEHFSMVLATVRKAFPLSLVHIFGAGAPRSCLAAFAMGAHSADSHAWRRAAGFGSIYLPGKGQRILEWNKPHKRPRPLIDDDDRRLLGECTCPACRLHDCIEDRISGLKGSFEPRSIHNAWVLNQEVCALRTAVQEERVPFFLESRLPTSWLEIVLAFRA